MNKNVLNKKTIDVIFLITFGLYLLENFIYQTTASNFLVFPSFTNILIRIVLGGIIIVRCVDEKLYQKKEAILMAFVSIAFAAVYFNTKYDFLLDLALLIPAAYKVNINQLAKVFFVAVGIEVFAAMLGATTGVYTNLVYSSTSRLRISLGMVYPTVFANIILTLSMTFWMAFDSVPEVVSLVLGIISFLNAKYLADSRTSMICSLLFCAVVVIHMIIKVIASKKDSRSRVKNVFKYLFAAVFVLAGIGYWIAVIAYGKNISFAASLNSLLSGRLKYTYDGLNNFGIHLFGANFNMIGLGSSLFESREGYNYLDSTYAVSVIRYGLTTAVAMCLLYVRTMVKAFDSTCYKVSFVLVVLAFIAISEPTFLDVCYNVLLLGAFADYSKEESEVSGKRWIKLGIAVVLFAGVTYFLPLIISWMKTLYTAFNLNYASHYNLVFVSLLIPLALIVLCLLAIFSLIDKKYRIAFASICLFLIGFESYFIYGQVKIKAYSKEHPLTQEKVAMQIVKDHAMGKVIVDEVPLLMKEYDIDYTVLGADASQIYKTVTLMTNSNNDFNSLITKKYNIISISNDYILYSNDQSVLDALKEAGYGINTYYSSVRNVDLIELAEMNNFEVNDEGGVIISYSDYRGWKKSYLNLFNAEYEVTVDLNCEAKDIGKYEGICYLVVTTNRNEQVDFVPIGGELFDDEGHYTGSYTMKISTSAGNVFYVVPYEGKTITVNSITYGKNKASDLHKTMDEQGRVIREEHYNVKGNLIITKGGYAIREIDYDENDKVCTYRYYGTDEMPIMLEKGYAEIRYGRDDTGRINYEAYFDENGKPCLNSSGYAARDTKYDDMGYKSYFKYYDTQGKVLTLQGKYAEVHYVRDELGNIIEESYYDEVGNPTMRSGKYAKLTRVFDEVGNNTEVHYFDTEGNPTITSNDYAAIVRYYDAFGNMTMEMYYDTNEQLTLCKKGYAILEKKYDENGDFLREIIYDQNWEVIEDED